MFITVGLLTEKPVGVRPIQLRLSGRTCADNCPVHGIQPDHLHCRSLDGVVPVEDASSFQSMSALVFGGGDTAARKASICITHPCLPSRGAVSRCG